MEYQTDNDISKKLSYLLRHCTNPLYIDLDGGWADTKQICEVLNIPVTRLIHIVVTDNKQRYSLCNNATLIRANQGHSIEGVKLDFIELQYNEIPDLLYHGTAERFVNSILKDGLLPMSRQFVHLSYDKDTAYKVGERHGKPFVFRIDAKKFARDGNRLYLSENGVFLARRIPREYIVDPRCPEYTEVIK